MPANWPIFIKNLSTQMSSGNIDGSSPNTDVSKNPDENYLTDFSKILAQEYFDAVKTSQTPFGNLHESGQKPVLEEGFKKGFQEIFNEIKSSEEMSNRLLAEKYADLFDALPEPDLSYNPYCELEKWAIENKDRLDKFKFYPFFETTCPLHKELDFFANVDFQLIKDQGNLDKENSAAPIKTNIARFSIKDFDKNQSYKIKYQINGEEQVLTSATTEGMLDIEIPAYPGKYTYKFVSILDSTGEVVIKEINKSKSIKIGLDGNITDIDVIDSNEEPQNNTELEALIPETHIPIPELSDEEIIDSLVDRVMAQNNGTPEFNKWINTIKKGDDKTIGRKVYNKIKEIANKNRIEYRKENRSGFYYTPETEDPNVDDRYKLTEVIPVYKKESTINQYVFQEGHEDRPTELPEWFTNKFICKFVYIHKHDKGKATRDNSVRNNINKKLEEQYAEERDRFRELQRQWANELDQENSEEDIEGSADGYDTIAKAIKAYWLSTAVQPFKASPAVPPCNIPSPGSFIPVYYGSTSKLASGLRRAFNTGKSFDKPPGIPVATKLVAAAIAAVCAKHLLSFKFIYVGQLSTPAGPIPMIGFVPVVF